MLAGGGKRKYGKLSLQKKVEIIKAAEMGYSQRALASRYNCGKTQIHLLVTQKAMWLDKWERARNGKSPEESYHFTEEEPAADSNLDDLVFDFYIKLSSSGVPVSGSMLQERAMQVAQELHQFNFTPDQDWLITFASQYQVALSKDDENTLTLLKSIGSRIREDGLVQSFELCDIYNLGEVRLAYKFVPSIDNDIKASSLRDYLTVSLCFNAVGAKEAELIVYDNLQHGDIYTELHHQCVSNWNGVMTQTLYEKRLTELNAEMSRQNRHILLLVDDSKFSGSLECQMSNVKVKPTSTYLQSQPLRCSVGNTFKFLYCRNLLRMLLAHSTSEGSNPDSAENLTLIKAVGLIQSAWDDLHPKTIENSFFDAGLKHFGSSSEDLNKACESDEALIEEIKKLVGLVCKTGCAEELSDSLFTPLIDNNFFDNASNCSDSDREECGQSISESSHMVPAEKTLYKCAQSSFISKKENISDIAHIRTMIDEALPYISKLDKTANLILSKAQLPKAKLLLEELGHLFEDAIADYKLKNVLENST